MAVCEIVKIMRKTLVYRCKLRFTVQKLLLKLFCSGATARAASAVVGVQHNTAKLFFRKLREVIRIERERERLEKIAGTVAIDEAYFQGFGKARRLRGRNSQGKIPVIGACQIHNGKKRVRIERIPAAKSEILTDFAERTVFPGAVIHTDSFKGYNHLKHSGFAHFRVNHSKEYKAKNGACTNAIESVWSACRRHFVRFCGGYRHRIGDFLAEMEMRFESGVLNFYRDLSAILLKKTHKTPSKIVSRVSERMFARAKIPETV